MNSKLNPLPGSARSFGAFAAALVIGLGGLTACGSDDPEPAAGDTSEPVAEAGSGISIADPWSRQPAEGQENSAVYGIVTNNTDETITAVSATTSVTDTVELHETLMDDGVMSMKEKDGGFDIAPGASFVFEPGGPHIMLLGIDPATYPDSVEVEIEFADGQTLAFDAEVRAIASDAMDDSDMDDSDMDDSDMDDTDMDDTDMDDTDMDDTDMDDTETDG